MSRHDVQLLFPCNPHPLPGDGRDHGTAGKQGANGQGRAHSPSPAVNHWEQEADQHQAEALSGIDFKSGA